ncbi:MAG: acyl dehydratase [Chloroflexi bacterium]|jgi:acyl dehydratase|nr:acyl dehydratase [Chloroflexota bacterium]
MLEFARKWGPQPFHLDEEAARSYPSGELTAPSGYMLGITTLLLARMNPPKVAVLANLEYERTKLPVAVRAGDELIMRMEHLEKRESQSRPDRGIVRTLMEVKNQHDQIVLSSVGLGLVARRKTK